MDGPLHGIRVVDVTTVMLGPYATQTLGDMGADVIKIEAPPAGDIARNLGQARTAGMSGSFLNINRNKRSLALDLKQDPARQALRRLVATADVFVHNMRAQAIERLGLGYEALVAIKPDLVYVAAYGFGREGPYASKPALDDAIQAASGLASLFVRQDGQPRDVPSAVADKIVGMTLSQAVLAALVHKSRSGEGQFVEVPMLETMVAFNLIDHLGAGAYASPAGRIGYARASSPLRRPFRTSDGFVCLLPYDDRQCRKFFEAVDRPELMQDPRFSSFGARTQHPDEFYGLVSEQVRTKSTAEWIAIGEANEIPCMPVVDIEDLPADPHLQAVGMFEAHEHPSEGPVSLVRSPIRFGRTPTAIRRRAPRYAEHSRELLRELGFRDEEIAGWIQSGAVTVPPQQKE